MSSSTRVFGVFWLVVALFVFGAGCSDDGGSSNQTQRDTGMDVLVDGAGSDTASDAESPVCGDNQVEQGEACDGSNLEGETCASLGLGEGELRCRPNCSGFDRSSCEGPDTCGDGAIQSPEACDGDELGGESCESQGFTGGTIGCLPNCADFDTSACTSDCVPDCDGRVCGIDPICGQSCGTCDGMTESCDAAGQCLQVCDLSPIDSDRTLDVDVPLFDVSGTVTVNGQQMADNTSNYTRGYLVFVDKVTGGETSVELGKTGAANYSAQLFGGSYDVFLRSFDGSYQDVFPGNGRVRLEEDWTITSDTTFDADVPLFDVSGTVTVNGQQMADNTSNYTRGYLVFVDKVTGAETSIELGKTGAANYSAQLFGGSYDVFLRSFDGSYQDVFPGNGRVRLEEDWTITSDTTFDADVPLFDVSGTVTVNGQQMADNTSNYTRGYLVFVDKVTGAETSIELGKTGAANYSAQLFGGSYDVFLRSFDGSYQDVFPGNGRVRLEEDWTITSDTTFDADVPLFDVSGTVTVNGQQMADNTSNYTRGYLVFVDKVTGAETSIELGKTGAANYSAQLFGGSYDVFLRSFDGSYQDVFPGNGRVRLEEDWTISSDTTFDADVPLFDVSGTVTVNGQQMADNTSNYTRGYLVFVDKVTGAETSIELGKTGAANYSAQLFGGSYDVFLRSFDGSYQDVFPGNGRVRLEEDWTITSDTTFDADVPLFDVSGTVTVNGQQMADNTSNYTRGYLVFVDKVTGAETSVELGKTGAANYSAQLFGGSYDVFLRSFDGSYQDVFPGNGRVRLLEGCQP